MRPQAVDARSKPGDVEVVLTGGGARAAYQVGVLRGIARLPETRFDIITGVSAEAINAAFLASRSALPEAIEELLALWSGLQVEDVFRADLPSLAAHLARWLARLASAGTSRVATRGLVDTRPLAGLLARALGEIAALVRPRAHGGPARELRKAAAL
jgi:NTE family protein